MRTPKNIRAHFKRIKEEAATRAPAQRTVWQVGEVTKDGIYLGQYEPKTPGGKSLGKVFNVFAAKEDYFYGTYNVLFDKLKKSPLFEGHPVKIYDDATGRYSVGLRAPSLQKMLTSGDYKGEWVVPPLELLKRLQENKKTFDFKEADFSIADYWSCSVAESELEGTTVFTVNFSSGETAAKESHLFSASICPVRFTPLQ